MESNEKEVNGEKPVNILNGGNSEIFNDSSLGDKMETDVVDSTTIVLGCNGTKEPSSFDQSEDKTAKSTSDDQSEVSKDNKTAETTSVNQSEASKEDATANPSSSGGVKLESDGRTLKTASAGGMSMMIIWAKDDNEENDPSDTESEHEKSDSDQDDHFQETNGHSDGDESEDDPDKIESEKSKIKDDENESDNDTTNGGEVQSINNMEDTFSENSNFSESKSRIESSEPEELKLFITDEIFDKNCTKVPTGYKCNVCSKIVSCIQAAKAHLKTHKFILFGAKSIETVADILKALNQSQDIPSDKWNLIYTDNLLCLLCIKKGDYTKINDEEKYDHALKVHAGQHICRVCHERFQYRETMLNHTRREHPDILFSCNVCHKDFFNKTELEKHQDIHTENKRTSSRDKNLVYSQLSETQMNANKKYSCHLCEKAFAKRDNMKYHLRKVHNLDMKIKKGNMTFKKMDDTMKASLSKSKTSEKSDVTVSKMKKNNLDLANAQYTSKPKDDQKSAEQKKLDEKSAEQKKLDEMCEKYIENVDDKFVCKFGDENVFTSLQGARCHMKTHIKVKTDDPALQAIKPSEIFEPVPNPITVTTPEGEFKFETVNDVLRALDSNPVPPIPDEALKWTFRKLHNSGFIICRLCNKRLKLYTKNTIHGKIKAHLNHVHCRNKQIDCQECGAKYTTAQQLMAHCKVHHPDILHHCPSCSKSYFEESELDKHKELHVENRTSTREKKLIHSTLSERSFRKHPCYMCTKSFSQSVSLREHLEKEHSVLAELMEETSSYGGSENGNELHMKEEPAEFLIQSMQTSNELNIKEEPADFLIQSLQTSDEEFDMNETSTKMNQKNKKNSNSFVRDGYQTIPEDVLEKLEKFEEITPLGFRYVKIIYNDIGLYLCDICNKTAPTKGSMRNHKQNHKRFDETVDNYETEMETKYEIKGFTIPEDEFEKLDKVEEITSLGFRYIKVIYKNEEVYVCEICRLTKPTKIGISNHMRHHGNPHKVAVMKKEVNTATKYNGDGSFSCKICGKSFPSEFACRGHMSWHKSKGKTIKRFGSLSGVNGHMTAHSRKGEYVSKESLKSKNSLNSGEDRITRSTDKVDEQNQFFFIRKELGENIYFCNFCDKNFTSKTGVLYHASRQHGDKQLVDNSAHDNTIFRCSQCPGQFTNKTDLIIHADKAHKPPKAYVKKEDWPKQTFTGPEAALLEKAKKDYESLYKTGRTSGGDVMFICKLCNKKYKSRANLPLHARIHTGEKPFSCEDCDLSFTWKYQLNEHRSEAHGQQLFRCSMCPKGFINKESLQHHKEMKHNGANNVKIILRNFACDICSITFTTQSHLSYHKNRAHKAKEIGKNIMEITSKEYKCPVCQKDFQTKDLITDHIKTAHKTLDDQSKKIALDMIDKLEIEVEERKKNELETFPCRVCNKRFITKHFLNKHVESLHNTSNSEASTSKRKFASAEGESPKKTKTLIPLYSCLLCEKSFISTEAVSAHMRIIHNSGFVKRMVPSTSPPPNTKSPGKNDKPYSCPICQKRFLTKEYIKHHVDRVHKDDVECSVCHQYFKHPSLLEEHISTAHKNYSNGGGQESLTHDVNIKSEVMDAEHAQVDEPQTSWLESSLDITAVKTEDIDDNDDSGEQYPEDGEYLESGGIAEEGQYFDEDTGYDVDDIDDIDEIEVEETGIEIASVSHVAADQTYQQMEQTYEQMYGGYDQDLVEEFSMDEAQHHQEQDPLSM